MLGSRRRRLAAGAEATAVPRRIGTESGKRAPANGGFGLKPPMIYAFDDCELDTGLFELRRGGLPCKVEPQIFDMLFFLLRHRERVVSKEEIVEEIWDGRIVTEATISTCMKGVRQAIGDDGRMQRLIRTVHGRGFRFVGDVRVEGEEGAGPVQPPTAARVSPVAPVGSQRPVIAVLPFDNLSGDLDEYFADGLTEDIITNLARFRELLVVGRTSSFRFKGQRMNLTDVCAELNAGYVVEGSVRRAGGRLRITAQLIDGRNGLHIWADSYDRDMEDLFAVQDEVTRTIAARLGVSVQEVAQQQAMKKSPAELDSYDCVLRARRYTALLRTDLHAEARELLERALELDPDNADAAALLANIYLAEFRHEENPKGPDPIERADAMARRALSLDPQHAYARCWLAMVHFFRKEIEAFHSEAERALALNPNDPDVLSLVGLYLICLGDFEQGIAHARRAQDLNPLHPDWYHFSFARYHYHHREYEKAAARVRRVAMPDFFWPHLLLAMALGQLEHPEAPRALARVFELKPGLSIRAEFEKWNTEAEDYQHVMEGLRKAGLTDEG